MSDYASSLEKVFHEILSKYAMMFGEPAGEGDFVFKPENVYVRSDIGFKGQFSGTMSIASTKGFCFVLAANVLGTEPGEECGKTGSGCDAMKEFINLTCGHFVTEAFGKKATADLTPPDAFLIGLNEWEEAVKSADVKFLVEGMPVAVLVNVEKNGGAE